MATTVDFAERRPTLTVLDGGPTTAQANREWKAAWEGIAKACEAGLSGLHPLHPRRDLLLEATRNARSAARQPAMRPREVT